MPDDEEIEPQREAPNEESTPQDSSTLENPTTAELAERVFQLQLRIDALEGQLERTAEQAAITADIVDAVATEQIADMEETDDRNDSGRDETEARAPAESDTSVIRPKREHAYFRKLW